MNMKWFAVLLVVVAALSLLRIVSQWRSFRRRTVTDWDEQFIMQLRKAGVNAFEEHDVDFFFTLPDAGASATVKSRLKADGFSVVGDHANPDGGYSLDMRRRMRLVVPEMQARTVRFNALAAEAGGKYDNWAIGTRPPGGTRG
jgi:Regulator of ribonuclease activity B